MNYASIGPVQVLHCRAEEALPPLAERSLVVTDPPWGINYRSGHNRGYRTMRPGWDEYCRDENFEPIEGDDSPFDPKPLLRFERVAIFGANYFAGQLPPSKSWVIWDKKLGKPDNGADCELIWTNFGKPARIFQHLWRGIIRAGEENVSRGPKLHPHQKPVALLRYLVELSGSDLPLIDPYCGSGSLGCAAIDLDRPCILMDCDEKWCEVTAKRLEARLSGK